MRTILASMILVVAIVRGHQVDAETYYVAPVGAVVAAIPDGSLAKPFASIGDALYGGKVRGGDTVLLKDGTHGSVAVYQVAFDAPVTIASQNGKQAHIDWISIRGASSNLTFERISVWPTDIATVPSGYVIETQSEASNIVFKDLDIRSDPAAPNYLQWDAAKWNTRGVSGISLGGAGNIAQSNQITGVYVGIGLNGVGSKALDNVVDGFNGDALRAVGNNTVLRGNLVKNCVATDGNHDDGIQGFKEGGGTLSGIVIDRNTILEWTAAPDHPLRCSLQGMFLSDAIYENLTVTNNLVSTSQYHGITLSGGRNSRILNNTIVNAKGMTGPYPWLKIWDTPTPVNVLVANNLAMSVSGPATIESNLTFRNNSVIGTPGAVFENAFAFDYRPTATSAFVDTADAASAPSVDILGNPRPSGNGPDRGAYEIVKALDTGVAKPPPENPKPAPDVPVAEKPVVTNPVVTNPVVTPVVKPVVTPAVEPVVKPVVKPADRWVRKSLRNLINRSFSRWRTVRF